LIPDSVNDNQTVKTGPHQAEWTALYTGARRFAKVGYPGSEKRCSDRLALHRFYMATAELDGQRSLAIRTYFDSSKH